MTDITFTKIFYDRHSGPLIESTPARDMNVMAVTGHRLDCPNRHRTSMSKHPRTYSRVAREALTMMGALIRLARKQRKMSEGELAARVGIARSTLQLIEKGHPKVEIGLVFEAATLVGVPLFVDEPSRLGPELLRIEDKLALLPQAVRKPRSEVQDDF